MKTEQSTNGLTPAVRAEAAAWVARLHGSARSRALESGFRRWLATDPAHARAFEIATEAWELGGMVSAVALPRMSDPFAERPTARRGARPALAIAAALCTVLVTALAASWFYLHREAPGIATKVGEQRMLTLDDGSRIYLNADTRLVVRQNETRREVQLETGEALFEVTPDPARPFVVTAGDREVIALGTSFLVRRNARRIAVTLVEGKVAVSPVRATAASAVTLAPGQRLVVSPEQAPKLDRPSLDQITAWRRGEVILDKTRLQDAADEMNRYSAVQIVIDDPAAANIQISGIFRAGDSVRFAQAIAETYQLSVEHERRRIVISAPRP
jgi:transmembrane sensor